MTNLNPEATVIGKIRNVLGNFRLPKANKSDNTLVFSISKSQEEANIQIVFDKELTPEQIKKIERITNGDVNKFFKNIDDVLTTLGITVNEVIVTGYVGKKVSLFPKHAGKVTFKNCKFKDNSQIYIQDNDVTFDGCTFGDGVSIHSLNENANVTIKDSKLPKKIGASVKQGQRILDRERALKFFGKFKGLTLQNNYDEERNGEKILGGLIDAGVAEIINNGEKQPILFKDNNGQLINSKLILKLYGGSLIKKSNLGQELYAAQIEAKKNDLISQNKADTNTSDEEIETHCIISKEEKILRSVSLVVDTFEYEKSLKDLPSEEEDKTSEEQDKEKALKSLEGTRELIARNAYEVENDCDKLITSYKETIPQFVSRANNLEEKNERKYCKTYEGKISYEEEVKEFFKEQFETLKGQDTGSNNDTTDSQPTQNNGTQTSANGEQYTDSDTQNQDQTQALGLNTNEAQNAGTTTNNTQASDPTHAQSTNAASDEKVADQNDNKSFDLNSNEKESDTSSNNGNIPDEESTETEEEEDAANGTPTQVNSNQNTNAASGKQFVSQANDDDTEPNSDEEESDTPSNNGNIPDEESTETEKEETKALKNSDVSAGTSDMENEQKEENNNQETTSSNSMH